LDYAWREGLRTTLRWQEATTAPEQIAHLFWEELGTNLRNKNVPPPCNGGYGLKNALRKLKAKRTN